MPLYKKKPRTKIRRTRKEMSKKVKRITTIILLIIQINLLLIKNQAILDKAQKRILRINLVPIVKDLTAKADLQMKICSLRL